jgi:hypothetical protein
MTGEGEIRFRVLVFGQAREMVGGRSVIEVGMDSDQVSLPSLINQVIVC